MVVCTLSPSCWVSALSWPWVTGGRYPDLIRVEHAPLHKKKLTAQSHEAFEVVCREMRADS
jgi:hypothetical protein